MRVVEARDDVGEELIFDSEVSLEMLVEELEELLRKDLCSARLGEGEVLVVSKLAEILLEDVLEVIKHLIQC